MASFSVFVRKSAERELRRIPKADLRRISGKIAALADDPVPAGALKLEGETRYRLRQGNWRVLYEIDFELKRIDIVKVGHRREIYR